MTTLAPLNLLHQTFEVRCVENRTKPPERRVFQEFCDRQLSQVRFEERSRSQGKGLLNSTSLGERLSSNRSSSLGNFGSPANSAAYAYTARKSRLELGIVGQDLLLGRSTGKPFQNLLNRNSVAPNTGFPEPHLRIDRDPFQQ